MKTQAARSVHLWLPGDPCVSCYIRGRIERFAKASYFCAIGFDGGYYGIQELRDGRRVGLFSLWHDAPTRNRSENDLAWVHDLGGSAFARPFGGEGEGIQSFVPFSWREGTDVHFKLHCSTIEDRTHISAFLKDGEGWQLVATLSRAGRDRWLTNRYAFVEDFRRDGTSVTEQRRIIVVDAWVQGVDGEWSPSVKGVSSADNGSATNCDVRLDNNTWILETGGASAQTHPWHSTLERTCPFVMPEQLN